MASMFETTHVCEEAFLKMKNVKSKRRTRLTNEYLKTNLYV